MKKFFTILSLSLFLVCLCTSEGQAQNKINASKLDKKINSYMSFPLLSQEDMIGEVSVSFTVNPKGKIDVLRIDSSNPHLIPYVMKRLNLIVLPKDDRMIGSIQNYLINFKNEENRI